MFGFARRAYHLYNFLRGIETMRWSKILGAAKAQGHLIENVPFMDIAETGELLFISFNECLPPADGS
jgi:hypothetical protein